MSRILSTSKKFRSEVSLRPLFSALLLATLLLLLPSCSLLRTSLPAHDTTSCLRQLQPFLSSLTPENILPVAEVTLRDSRTPVEYLQLFVEIVASETAKPEFNTSNGSASEELLQNQPESSTLRLVGISPLLGREFITTVLLDGGGNAQDRISIVASSRFLSDAQLKEITLLYLLLQQRNQHRQGGDSDPCSGTCGTLSLKFICRETVETLRLDFIDPRLRGRYSFRIRVRPR